MFARVCAILFVVVVQHGDMNESKFSIFDARVVGDLVTVLYKSLCSHQEFLGIFGT